MKSVAVAPGVTRPTMTRRRYNWAARLTMYMFSAALLARYQ
jgi:hypothetical protein